jgi:hypothetical protein
MMMICLRQLALNAYGPLPLCNTVDIALCIYLFKAEGVTCQRILSAGYVKETIC